MSSIKIFGYLFFFFSIYIAACVVTSLAPIVLNVFGIGFANESFLSKQRLYYMGAPMRSVIQGNAGCVQADKNLGYKQRIGDCIFENFEFDTILKFDDFGAEMPNIPENTKEKIIVVGDSHAMGWGVSFDETFAYILSENGYQITNLSMSSYGTEQEILSAINSDQFDEADTIIIQYCDNDLGKNKKNISEYVEKEFKAYENRTKSDFTIYDKLHNAAKFYLKQFSIKDLFIFPLSVVRSSFKKFEPPNAKEDSLTHQRFINDILNKYGALKTKNIIIFYSNGYGRKFADWNRSQGNINFVDLNIQPSHYYMLDDHLNSTGHQYIANSLITLLTDLKPRDADF